MKIKDGFILKDVAGSKVVLATGEQTKNFKGIITFNEVGAEIFDLLDGTNSVDEIVNIIAERYDVSVETVKADVVNLIEKMKSQGLIEE